MSESRVSSACRKWQTFFFFILFVKQGRISSSSVRWTVLCLHLGIHYSYYFRVKKHGMFVSLHGWMQITLKGIAVIQTKVNVNIYHCIRHHAQILLSSPLWVCFENLHYPWIIESSRLFGSFSIPKQAAASCAATGKWAECHYFHYYSYICMLCLA